MSDIKIKMQYGIVFKKKKKDFTNRRMHEYFPSRVTV